MTDTPGAVFASGARSSEMKPRYDLIPMEASRREAVRMAEGAAAHGEQNYQQGAADTRYVADRMNHLIEHALLYASGDRSTDHLAAVRANAGMLIWLEEHGADDRKPIASGAHKRIVLEGIAEK